ncbi:MAG: hypothetical protein H0Z24_05825 [Thermosipho sp. (in: Bacteria)]|nr:hypothetical protein [Thermosipho sp. (in: thermotogales)]
MFNFIVVWTLVSLTVWLFVILERYCYNDNLKVTRLDIVIMFLTLPGALVIFAILGFIAILLCLVDKFVTTKLWVWLNEPVIKNKK